MSRYIAGADIDAGQFVSLRPDGKVYPGGTHPILTLPCRVNSGDMIIVVSTDNAASVEPADPPIVVEARRE